MSPFMSSMLPAGLIEMPPESKHTPLPMNATGAVFFDFAPFQRMTTKRLSRFEPCPTASSAPMPSLCIAFSSNTSTSTPSFSSSCARSAKLSGKTTLAGSLTSVRASSTPSATGSRTECEPRAASASATSSVTSCERPELSSSSDFLVLYLSNL